MQYSTNYNLNLVEGTDIVNPLVIDKPNYQTIDAAMKANKDAAVDAASHTKAGTVHAIVRTNTDANTFRFVASAPFTAGDTFTVDGVAVTGINTAGEGLETNDFVIGASVLCVLNSGTLTLNVNKKVTIPATYDAADIVFDNTGTGMSATNAQTAIEEVNTNTTNIGTRINAYTLGTPVDLTQYNAGNPYVASNDGYIVMSVGGGVGVSHGYMNGQTVGVIYGTASEPYPVTMTFVRKGSTLYGTATGLGGVGYTPLV